MMQDSARKISIMLTGISAPHFRSIIPFGTVLSCLLLLDEPTAGVAPKARHDFWDDIYNLAAFRIIAEALARDLAGPLRYLRRHDAPLGVILLAGRFLFGVPLIGSLSLLLAASLLFTAANLGVGLTFSTLARNQLQAVQMAFFFFLPLILLSGFMFPFRGTLD